MDIGDAIGSQVAQLGKQVGNFKSGGQDGQFTVNESGGQALLAAIDEMRSWINDRATVVSGLKQRPALGSSDGAEVMKPHDQSVAVGGDGFLQTLEGFKEALDDFEAGINAAMRNYQTLDDGSAKRF